MKNAGRVFKIASLLNEVLRVVVSFFKKSKTEKDGEVNNS